MIVLAIPNSKFEFVGASSSQTSTSISTSQTVAANTQPCSYQIYTEGSTTYAQNCVTGSIAYSGTVPETVINDAIAALTSGGAVYIEAGTYTFTTDPVADLAAIGTQSVSNIELYGDGNSTILNAGTNLNAAIIGVVNANGWYIHDLQINGNRTSQSASGESNPYLAGIDTYNSSNDVIEHCYVHDDKTYGIAVESGSSNRVLDNWVVNSNANGIEIYGGSNNLVEGNVVNGASDVGISLSGSDTGPITNSLCTENIVSNVNMADSPWGLNSGAGIMVGDNGADQNVTVSNNQISTAKFGVSVDPGSGTNVAVTVSGNTIQGTTTYGVYVEETSGITIANNSFTFTAGAAWKIWRGVSSLVIQNNYVNRVLVTGTATVSTSTTSTTTSTTHTASTASTMPATTTDELILLLSALAVTGSLLVVSKWH